MEAQPNTSASSPTVAPVPAPRVSAPINWWQSRVERRRLMLALVFIGPWIIGLVAFTIYPILWTIYLSFHRYSGFGAMEWIGLANYRRMFEDPLFATSLWNTGGN